MGNKEIKIKEFDLHAVIKDLVNDALEIDRPNKEKICRFVVNLVQNGGNKTTAAYDAGYGSKKDKEGRIRPEEERKKIAGNEGSRLLENEGIAKLYDRLMSNRFMSQIFTKSFTKEHVASVMYQIGMNILESNPRQAIVALKEASTLCGFYEQSKDKEQKSSLLEDQEYIAAAKITGDWLRKDKREEEEVKPLGLKSEVYN